MYRFSVCGVLLLVATVGFGCDRAPETDGAPSSTADESAEQKTTTSAGSSDSDSAPPDGSPYVGRLDLKALEESGKLDAIEPVEVTIERDPAYETEKTYRGWPLEAIMAEFPGIDGDRADYVVQFIAVDGYKANVPLDELAADRGVVAFRDLNAPDGKRWSTFTHGDEETTPAPYYIVWRDADHAADELPWAYKLSGIGLAPYRALWGESFPEHDANVREGFTIFRENCIKCHSVNLSGGSVGPELNVPMSVTEYWKPNHLRAFIRNAPSYRAGIAMPPLENLTDEQLDALLAYLESMVDAKVCESADACARIGESQ